MSQFVSLQHGILCVLYLPGTVLGMEFLFHRVIFSEGRPGPPLVWIGKKKKRCPVPAHNLHRPVRDRCPSSSLTSQSLGLPVG